MSHNFSQKKLLILGGMKMACDLVRRAQEMGAFVIVADFDLNSPAKAIANKAVYVDATNVNELVALCKKERIDGVTTGYVDLLLPYCLELAKRMNIPYYADLNMIDVSTNKESFKDMCKKYDLPYPKSFVINDEDLIKASKTLPYPVFVKPMDASGSRGATVCWNPAEFVNNYINAKKFSNNNKAVVEEYLTGTDFILDYIIVEGEPHLLSMFDRKVCEDRSSAVNHANLLLSPSKSLDNYIDTINKKVISAFKKMNFKNGLIFMQGYWNEEKITFFEMGCRLGGTFPEIVQYFTTLNPMKMLINYAFTGEMMTKDCIKKINPRFDGIGVVLNILTNKPHAIVSKIEGLDEIKRLPNVINCIQYLNEGDEYDLGTQTDKPVAILYIASKHVYEIKETLDIIYKNIVVLDENGNNLLMPFYSTSILESYDKKSKGDLNER